VIDKMQNVVKFPDRAIGFSPARLVEARVARQVSRAELARELGLSGQAIGYYETGERRPDMSMLLRLSQILEQPVAFFLREPSSLDGRCGARFFRSVGPKSNRINQALDVKTKWLWEIVSYLQRFVRLPTPNLPTVGDPVGNQYSSKEVEEAAIIARRHWGLGDGPIANMVALLETHGLIVSRFETGSLDIDAFSTRIDGRPYVVLGSDKGSCARSRFDAAHELGHLLLHGAISQEDLQSPQIRERIEQEANWFAGAFLLPRAAILAEFYSTRMSHLQGLKQRWRVSMQAIAHRCKHVGAIDPDQYILFRKQMSARQWLKREPLDDEIPLEQAKLLLKAWKLLLEKGVVSEASFDEEVGFSLEFVERLSGQVPAPRRRLEEGPNIRLFRAPGDDHA
jgi:Zn-dependent peptidase ImmA (M78 family)/transcriptional regulator with XRE-family HTH domain